MRTSKTLLKNQNESSRHAAKKTVLKEETKFCKWGQEKAVRENRLIC
jgi:hypothetical protein